jgi:hypothetical protein
LQRTISPTEIVKVDLSTEIVIPDEWEFKWDYSKHEPIDFYKRISIPGTKIEISDAKKVYDIDNKNPVMWIIEHDDRNMYFCWWVKASVKTRCWDNDIVKKCYFWLDIDVRKDIWKITWEIISDNQLYWYIDEIQKILDASDYGDYEYVVASWNWVHIYYIGEPVAFKNEIYKSAVNRIYKDIDRLLIPLWFKTDKATSNVSSLFRCPLTLNYSRVSKYNLDLWPCFIYDVRKSDWITFNSLEAIWNQIASEKEQQIEERKKMLDKEIKKIKKEFKWDDVFTLVKNIPAHELFSKHTWILLAKDWKNFVSNKDWKYMGCFYNPEKNKIINIWTPHIMSDENSYWPFDYAMKEILGLSDCKESIKETIEWFKSEYGF